MRFATRDNGTADGELLLVASDGSSALPLGPRWPSLLHAITQWPELMWDAASVAEKVARGEGEPLDPASLRAPLPRTWQWLDGSAFPQHGELMQKAFHLPPMETDKPLMYQGLSHQFLSGHADVPVPTEDDCIDFEGEFAVVTDDVPMGCTASEALGHIKLVLLLNDWSLRAVAPAEMKTGFGWIQAKPACSVAPFALTPDELGDAWRDGRVCLPLRVEVNGAWFGHPNGEAMAYGFHELIAHASRTRALCAGTIVGSGTVSNTNYDMVGSTCISERRAIEMIATGEASTGFLRFGDRVRMIAQSDTVLFGAIDQQVCASSSGQTAE
ncbi:fumarylacetoacetate hydrolase family protein [Sphingobium sp.]|uniref:fumarylacetoacetate hydrolase family protein n=1 Tax=Sphingobium sp. TaxID=1912891 RepID=UPI0035C74E28